MAHAGYTSLGNGQAFFEENERELQGDPQSGTISGKGYYRDFMSMDVVCPYESRSAQVHGKRIISLDMVVEADGSTTMVIDNRRVENLPDGPKFPVEDGTSEPICSNTEVSV